MDFVRQQPIKRIHQANILSVLDKLFTERERMPAGHRILFSPFKGYTAGKLVGYKEAQDEAFPAIPDDIAIPLANEAVKWVTERSSEIVSVAAVLQEARAKAASAGVSQPHKQMMGALVGVPLKRATGEWLNRPTDVSGWYDAQRDLVAACYILISLLVGPRAHEMMSFIHGCVKGPFESDDGSLELFYITGKTSKRSPNATGHSREWVLGARPIGSSEMLWALQAVQALTDLSLAKNRTADGLFFSPRTGKPLILSETHSCIRKFIRHVTFPRPWHITTHQFRKTFGRFVGQHDGNGLSALAQQLGHVWLGMTTGYAGNDSDLNRLLTSEHAAKMANAMADILASPTLAGNKGMELVTALAPLRAKLASPSELVQIARRLVETPDLAVYPSAWGICYFRAKLSECSGTSEPNYAARNPSVCAGCDNLIVTEKHRAFHVWRAKEYRKTIATYPSAPDFLVSEWKLQAESSERILMQLDEQKRTG